MPPLPKPAATRQRRNHYSTTAKLDAIPLGKLPKLPARMAPAVEWHPRTLAMWRNIARSPMVAEYLQSDIDGLFVIAELFDLFWQTGDVKYAAELRQQRQCFGLTPIDRRRLQWEIQKVENADAKKNPPAESRRRVTGDPRNVLHAVSA